MVMTEDLTGAVAPGPEETPITGPPRLSRRLQVWRSPEGQPPWARPALLVIAAVAAFAYAWGMTDDALETFYGGAVRSMSQSWHNFFFASFDPWGTVSIDKLPGALWVQALSVRAFGFHIWAFVLPQVVEGTLAVLVLYRVVRRVAGAGAGLAAAAILAVSPATILLNRGNISDTLLILLLLAATNATLSAIESGRWQSLVVAGVWVGLAFQTKMLQSWLVLPGLFIAYLMAAPLPTLAARLRHVVLAGLAVLVVSLSWMTAISVVPAHDRPYVDGSCDNSVFSQVFLYNGLDRSSGHILTQAGCRPESPVLHATAVHLRTLGVGTVAIPGGPTRFLSGPFGRLAAWLFFPSLVAALGLCVIRRKEPRTDLVRASVVLWLAWLAFTWSSIRLIARPQLVLPSRPHPAHRRPLRHGGGRGVAPPALPTVRKVLMATVAGGAAYAMALIPGTAGVWGWVLVSTVACALGALGLLALSLRGRTPLAGAGWLRRVGCRLVGGPLLGLGHGGGGPPRTVRDPVSVSPPLGLLVGGEPGGPVPPARAQPVQSGTAPCPGDRHHRIVRPAGLRRVRHRARVPPPRRLHRSRARPDHGRLHRRRGQPAGLPGAGGRQAADQQPCTALGHGALPEGEGHLGQRAGQRRGLPALHLRPGRQPAPISASAT